jgi:hypothetical protein
VCRRSLWIASPQRSDMIFGNDRVRFAALPMQANAFCPERSKAGAFLSDPSIQDLFKVRHETTTSKLLLVDGCS